MENTVAPSVEGLLPESLDIPVDGPLPMPDPAQVLDVEAPSPHIPAELPEDASTGTIASEASSLKRSKPHDELDEGWQTVAKRSPKKSKKENKQKRMARHKKMELMLFEAHRRLRELQRLCNEATKTSP